VSKECLSTDQLAAAESWSANDARRRHLDSCTRCQSLLLSLDAFMDPPDVPEGTDLEDMRARLTTDFRNGIWQAAPAETEPVSKRHTFSLFRPIWRPALGLAAILALAFGLPRVLNTPSHQQGYILRSDTEPDPHTIITLPPIYTETDGVRTVDLRWRLARDVESYRVLLYDSDFQEIARQETGSDTVLVLTPDTVPISPEFWDQLFWRVYGQQAGDEVARSSMNCLDLPDR